MDQMLTPDAAIMYLLQHISGVLGREDDQALQEQLGVGVSQFKILQLLQRQPEMQQRQLADHLGQTEASISRQVKLMRQKGLLAQRVDPENRRAHITELTVKGAKLTDAAQAVLLHAARPLVSQLSDKQQKQLAESLRVMHEWLCAPGKPAACDRPFRV